MSSVRIVLVILACVAVSWLADADAQPLETLTHSELARISGGACFTTTTSALSCAQNSSGCQIIAVPNNGGSVWTKTVDTLQTEAMCIPATGDGHTQCTVGTPQPCSKTFTCSDNQCQNCGNPAITNVNSVATLSGSPCGPGG